MKTIQKTFQKIFFLNLFSRSFLFALFLLFSLFTVFFPLSNTLKYHTSAPNTRIIKSHKPTPLSQERASEILNPKPWLGHFSAKTFKNTTEDRLNLLNIKRNLRKTMQLIPDTHTLPLEDLEVRNQKHASRGMANHEKVIIHSQSIDNDDELISVFLHEIGHIVDLGLLQGKHGIPTPFHDHTSAVLSDDKSYQFYRLSWIDNNTKKPSITEHDFVSGYAQSNPFEDFAESYLLYRMHGEKFRSKMENSLLLRQKYNFLKRFVFNNKEFQTEKDQTLVSFPSIWDVTLLPIQS